MPSINEDNQKEQASYENDDIIRDETELYPERKGSQPRSLMNRIFRIEERKAVNKLKCEMNVYKCMKESALVKLMMAALKSSGCEIDLRRHISCEICDTKVTGGYDPHLNQIVVCHNTAPSQRLVQGVLAHEMIHMFDFCRHNLDPKNIDHLACTEIRAANLCHCSFLGAWVQGLASPFNVKEAHQICVKDKAIKSILSTRKVSESEAQEAVDRVFKRCYNDLEPVGRRLRRNSEDMEKAYAEGAFYGYI
nr:mitochondrial inner membrane protease ATP23 homolog isoform X1 [Megalopta genalis]XP_033332712.1 mitochondrial inner membrane protease ATP23 homolog isoform X2 [Megalopta genalis]